LSICTVIFYTNLASITHNVPAVISRRQAAHTYRLVETVEFIFFLIKHISFCSKNDIKH